MDDDGTSRPPALEQATAQDWLGSNQDPDVLLSVPDLGVDKITLSVDNLRATSICTLGYSTSSTYTSARTSHWEGSSWTSRT
jgi:hypothetical protein